VGVHPLTGRCPGIVVQVVARGATPCASVSNLQAKVENSPSISRISVLCEVPRTQLLRGTEATEAARVGGEYGWLRAGHFLEWS
jgi:hypothetical protein